MCGIAGYVGRGTKKDLWKMIKAIEYRGPDSRDVFEHDQVGLAHARLKIIDLSESANQPFFTCDRQLVIVFNGEIYNYRELKKRLLSTGKYRFRTSNSRRAVKASGHQVFSFVFS